MVCFVLGIMGFARVMPGDSFEVSIRHGNQKWKSKGFVARDSEQRWEQDRRALGIQINSSLTVKVAAILRACFDMLMLTFRQYPN